MSLPLGLNDSFTEEGLWWLDGHEGDRISGTLTYDPLEGPVLSLLGTLRDFVSSMNAAFGSISSENVNIYGVTKKGKRVTLLDAINSSRQFNMPGIPNETWKSNYVVIGWHVKGHDEAIFSKSYIRFENIEKWLGHRPYTMTHDWDDKSLTIRADKPREAHFASHDDFEVGTVGSVYSSNTPDTRYTLDIYSQMTITPKRPQSLDWHFSKGFRLQELASLCMGHFLPLLSVELRGPEENQGFDLMRPAEVHVYARLQQSDPDSRPQHESPVLSGPELVEFNPRAIQVWFDQYEIFSPAIGLFFTITSQRQMYGNIRFTLAVQALEVFHRRTSQDSVISTEDFTAFHEKLVEAIPATTDARMKEKIKGTYRFLNEPSLSQRLKTIIKFLTSEFGSKPPAFHKGYIQKIVDTRNYYTHFSSELSDRKFDSAGMYWASRRMILLLSLLFLMRLGISAGQIAPLLERHREFEKLWTAEGNPF